MPAASSAEPQRVEAARDADAVTRAAVRGERRLERGDLRAVHERSGLDQVGDVGKKLFPKDEERGCRVEERNGDGGLECGGVGITDRLGKVAPPTPTASR